MTASFQRSEQNRFASSSKLSEGGDDGARMSSTRGFRSVKRMRRNGAAAAAATARKHALPYKRLIRRKFLLLCLLTRAREDQSRVENYRCTQQINYQGKLLVNNYPFGDAQARSHTLKCQIRCSLPFCAEFDR